MESVLALEVGAAARRIFSRAIWGEGIDGKGDGSGGTGHRPPSPPQEGVTGIYMWGGKKTWGASLGRDGAVEGGPPPLSPGDPQCSPAHHVLRQAWQEALVQDLRRDLLHFFFPLMPGETRKPQTRSCHQHRGPGSAPGSPTPRAGYPRLLPEASPHIPPSAPEKSLHLPQRSKPPSPAKRPGGTECPQLPAQELCPILIPTLTPESGERRYSSSMCTCTSAIDVYLCCTEREQGFTPRTPPIDATSPSLVPSSF